MVQNKPFCANLEGMRQICWGIGLPSCPRDSSSVVALPSSSRVGEHYHNKCTSLSFSCLAVFVALAFFVPRSKGAQRELYQL